MTSCIQVKEWDRMKHALILDHIQGRVKETLLRALKSHLCLQAVNNHCSECRWERQEDLRVAFIDLETRGFLNIPSYKCEMCGDVISVEPEDVGCFPATPVQPVTWFGHGLLRAVSFCKGPKKISVQGTSF